MKKHHLFISALFLLFSCGKTAFIKEMQGKWQVTEINYVFDDHTLAETSPSMYFIFQDTHYQTLNGDSVVETGTYSVNGKVTQIEFFTSLGNDVYIIEEKTATYQHWKSKKKIVDFYLDFKLEKIE